MLKIFFSCFCVFFIQAQTSTGVPPDQQAQVLPSTNPLSVCASCHGLDGNDINPVIPKLAGQYENYLAEQLYEFKKGEKGHRNNPLMYPIAIALTDEEILSLSTYYASQKKQYAQAEKRDDLIYGQRLYKGGLLEKNIAACSACHGPTGFGNEPAKIPSLAGQHHEYLSQQLKNYRDGSRQHPIMSLVAKKLSDEDIEAVTNYLQGLS
jgi:cytochrome c553